MKLRQKISIEKIAKQLIKFNSFAIFLHTRPDGDTVGAGIGLKLALTKLGKSVEIFCDTVLSENFLHFDECKAVNNTFFGKYDAYVAVDCANLSRLGNFADNFERQNNTFTIDHHKNEPFSQFNCIYSYSSTCQIVYEILDCIPVELDRTIATYLFMGLSTDTGNFSHSNTDAATFNVASKLMAFEIDNDSISRIFFKDISINKLKLLQLVLSRIRIYYEGQLVVLYVMSDDLSKLGLGDDSTEGIVQYAINVNTAKVGVSICQHSGNSFRVSMRSKNNTVDVSQICQVFGGGGHRQASGCMLNGFFEDVSEKIVKAVGDFLNA